MDIEITSGEAARSLLEQPRFLDRWRDLAAGDPKFTLLQEPAFVVSWFRVYDDAYEPLFVQGRAGGELQGLLPLAVRRSDGALRHAGAEQAEYHGWLATPGSDRAFLTAAIRALRDARTFRSWSWRWCPPGAPADAFDKAALAGAGIHVVTESRPSPIWDLTDPAKLAKILGSRSLRSKFNRFKRTGEVRLERIQDPARTRELMPMLARQCDFRQEVVNGVRPFADDPRKADFFLGRQDRPEANHFTVLWHGDAPLAFHFGGCDGKTCLLGLSAYDPSQGKNSPGTLLIVELARLLSEEGYERLDLTPGSDPYKQRFATEQVDLRRVTLHGSSAHALRARAKGAARGALQRATASRSLAAQDRWMRVQRGIRRALRGGGTPGLRAAGRYLRQREEFLCLVRAAAPAERDPQTSPTVSRQDWDVLPDLEPRPYFESRRERLADAIERFGEGQLLYRDGEGSWLAWRSVKPRGPLSEGLDVGGSFELLGGFENLGQVPGSEPSFSAFLAAMVADSQDPKPQPLVLCLPAKANAARAVAETQGFVPLARATHRRVLGRSRWEIAPTPTAESQA